MLERITRLVTLLLPLWLMLLAPAAWSQGKLALIIDDVGYNKHDADAIALDGDLTYAILPHTPHAVEYAEMARKANKDVILHIPMESITGKDLGPGALLSDMTRVEVESRLSAALEEIPFAIGINNHMGSLLTQKTHSMRWTMEFLQRNDLFFLDSKTSNQSVGEEQALRIGVPALHRNVFIDNQLDEAYMQKQFNHLVRIAQKYRRAIGIAHPHPQTIKFLAKVLPTLEAQGVTLVPISSLLPQKIQFAQQQQNDTRKFD